MVYCCDSIGIPDKLISKNIKFVTVASTIASFLIQIQPTIQEIIKVDASKSMTLVCGDKKIEIKGESEIEEAITLLKELNCESDGKSSSKHDSKVNK
jgi:hypothetical protein